MISLPSHGPVDAEITQTTPRPFATSLLPDAPPLPKSTGIVAVTPSPRSWHGDTSRLTSPRMPAPNNKGKGVRYSLDWDCDLQREGKSASSLPQSDIQVAPVFVHCVELAYQLLASLPRARLATVQRRILPLLQFDLVGVSLVPAHLFTHLLLSLRSLCHQSYLCKYLNYSLPLHC